MIQRLVMISKEYPTDRESIYAFVDKLACGFADAGVQVTVIAPLSLTRALLRGKSVAPARAVKRTPNGAELVVLRPRTLSFSSRQRVGTQLTYRFFRRALKAALGRMKEKPDALYGHFVAFSGMAAAELGAELGVPSFLGYGESSPAQYAAFDKDTLRAALKTLTGVVSVSSENVRELKAQGIVGAATRFGAFPNAVDADRFHPMDRAAARAQLGFDLGAFIVSFVGSFIERKGVGVLSAALKSLGDVQSIFIGKGDLSPDCPGMLHCGPLLNERVPLYLAASDAFVLPTLAEGCCNAIVEALGMGLPVISSNRPFNDDILDDGNALRVDPTDARAVAEAIARLRDDAGLRARLAEGARCSGETLSMPARVRSILAFMNGVGERIWSNQ